jgi:hypothetical protein
MIRSPPMDPLYFLISQEANVWVEIATSYVSINLNLARRDRTWAALLAGWSYSICLFLDLRYLTKNQMRFITRLERPGWKLSPRLVF